MTGRDPRLPLPLTDPGVGGAPRPDFMGEGSPGGLFPVALARATSASYLTWVLSATFAAPSSSSSRSSSSESSSESAKMSMRKLCAETVEDGPKDRDSVLLRVSSPFLFTRPIARRSLRSQCAITSTTVSSVTAGGAASVLIPSSLSTRCSVPAFMLTITLLRRSNLALTRSLLAVPSESWLSYSSTSLRDAPVPAPSSLSASIFCFIWSISSLSASTLDWPSLVS
mmetsp:Transcript_2279/g.9202  ORF Transcript_2279/g.9202 Transcript_2279/m.9202 type:complete len:226 (-) Transcript_2279:1020-1697(-)